MDTVLSRVDSGLENGRTVPLMVQAVFDEHNYRQLCPILTRYLPHICALRLSISPDCGSAPEVMELLTSPAPKLEFLELAFSEVSEDGWLSLPQDKLKLFGGEAHSLKGVELKNVPFVLSASRRTNLRNLRVIEERYHTLSTEDLYEFLIHAPSIEFLDVQGILYEDFDGPALTLPHLRRIKLGNYLDTTLCLLDVIIPADGCSLRLMVDHIYDPSPEQMHDRLVRLSNCLHPFLESYFKSRPESMYIRDDGGALFIRSTIIRKPSAEDHKYFFEVILVLGPNGNAGDVILKHLGHTFDFSLIRNFLLEKVKFDASGKRSGTIRILDSTDT